MCVQEVFGVHIDDPVDQTKYGSSLSLDVCTARYL